MKPSENYQNRCFTCHHQSKKGENCKMQGLNLAPLSIMLTESNEVREHLVACTSAYLRRYCYRFQYRIRHHFRCLFRSHSCYRCYHCFHLSHFFVVIYRIVTVVILIFSNVVVIVFGGIFSFVVVFSGFIVFVIVFIVLVTNVSVVGYIWSTSYSSLPTISHRSWSKIIPVSGITII